MKGINNESSLLSRLKKIGDSANLKVATTVLATSLILGGCGERMSEINYASNNDVEGKLSTMLKDYSSNKGPSFNSGIISPEEILKMENLSKEVTYSLSSIQGLEKKVIFVDLEGPYGLVVNETLKKLQYNTTLNYYLNWSDSSSEGDSSDGSSKDTKDVVNYDKLFSLVSQYKISKEDDYIIDENNGAYVSKPWAIMLDYNRLPDSIESYTNNPENTFPNLYGLTENDLPSEDIFLDKKNQLRDGVVLVTYSKGINQDIKEYLEKLLSKGIKVQVIFIDGEHVEGLDEKEYQEYKERVSHLLNNPEVVKESENESTHANGGGYHGGFYPYWLYGSNYDYANKSTSISPSSYKMSSTNAKMFSSEGVSKVSIKGTNAFNGLKTSSSSLSKIISSSRISGAKGGIG